MTTTRMNGNLDRRQAGWARWAPIALLLPVSLAACLVSHPAVAAHARPAAGGLHVRRLPDGNGTIALPAGWRILEADQGRVRVAGPEGIVSIGFAIPLLPPTAQSGTPAQVARQIASQLGARGYKAKTRMSWPYGTGQQSIIDWQAEAPGVGRMEGRSLVSVRHVNEGPRTGFFPTDEEFVYREDDVAAPAGQIRQNLPLLTRIWRSCRVSPHAYDRIRDRTVADMQGAADAMNRSATNRIESALDQNAGMIQIINGTWTVQDTAGRRGDWNSDDLEGKIQRYNKRHPNQPVHEVPMDQLRHR